MKKLLLSATAFGLASFVLSFSPAMAEDTGSEDAYNEAYSVCSEKADNVEGDYDTVFNSCMKEKGFPTGEAKEPAAEEVKKN